MDNLSINSKILPIIYFKYKDINKYNMYENILEYRKKNIIIFKLFIKEILNKKLNKNIVSILKNYYLIIDNKYFSKNIKNTNSFYKINNKNQIDKIYKYNYNKYLHIIFNLQKLNHNNYNNTNYNNTKTNNTKTNLADININYKNYVNKFYIRYNCKNDSITERINIQCKRINDYSILLNQIFRYKKGIFNKLNNKILNKIFVIMNKKEPNLGFIYVNCINFDKLYKYIAVIEKDLFIDELNYKYQLNNIDNENFYEE